MIHNREAISLAGSFCGALISILDSFNTAFCDVPVKYAVP